MIGFDIDAGRIEELRAGHDRTREVEPADLSQPTSELTRAAGRRSRAPISSS